LIFPFTRLNATLYEYLFAFAQVISAYFSQTTPGNNPMPFRTLLIVAVLVFPPARGSNRKGSDSFAGRGISDLRVSAQIAEQQNLVQGPLGHNRLLSSTGNALIWKIIAEGIRRRYPP
jgi:hypothetical protein